MAMPLTLTEETGLEIIESILVQLDQAPHELHMDLLDELIGRALDEKDRRTDDMADASRHSESPTPLKKKSRRHSIAMPRRGKSDVH